MGGDNLNKVSDNMPWFKGWTVKIKKEKVSGHTLIDALEKVVKPPKRNNKKAFRMPVSGVYKIKGVGDVITGRVEQGAISPGANVRFYPTGCTGNIFSIEMHHKSVEIAGCGDNVGVNVKKLPKENMPHTGDVMAIDDIKVDPNPPKAAAEFTALVFVQDHPGKLSCGKQEKDKKTGETVCKGGFTPSIHIRTAKAPCQMTWGTGRWANPRPTRKSKACPTSKRETRPRWCSNPNCPSSYSPSMSASHSDASPPWTPTRSLCSEKSPKSSTLRSKRQHDTSDSL